MLALRRRTWKETVLAVRGKWDKKYGYTDEFGGQGDPAELLGEIQWDDPAWRWLCTRRTTFHQCKHSTETPHEWPMLVLSLPEEEGTVDVSDLINRYLEPELLRDLKHDDALCGVCDQEGEATLSFEGVQPDTCVLRINRYTQGLQRRGDQVHPDPRLELGGNVYSLCAVIEHKGKSTNSGHYIMYLRTPKGWEKRDDESCIAVGMDEVPPCTPGDVHVLVYKKI